jgi:hypothetical protein
MPSPREMANAASCFDYRLFTLELSSRFLCAIANHDQREIARSPGNAGRTGSAGVIANPPTTVPCCRPERHWR